LKLKHQQQRGQPVIFRGEERKQEEKKYIGDKPLHDHRHTPHHKEDGMLTLLMTWQKRHFFPLEGAARIAQSARALTYFSI
jgi:hypothetical protein